MSRRRLLLPRLRKFPPSPGRIGERGDYYSLRPHTLAPVVASCAPYSSWQPRLSCVHPGKKKHRSPALPPPRLAAVLVFAHSVEASARTCDSAWRFELEFLMPPLFRPRWKQL